MKIFCAYLPQFHQTKINDLFWERGFTDWVTTRNAKKYFKGHNQPLRPGLLKEYNLLDKEILKKHSIQMKKSGIDAFAVYHYHFNRNQFALNKPVEIIRLNKNIKFNFFFYWVNSDWTRSWVGEDKTIIYKQNNSLKHALNVIKNAIKYFKDNRYEKLNGRPLFIIHDTSKFDLKLFKIKANRILNKNKIKNLYIVGNLNYLSSRKDLEFCDSVINWPPDSLFLGKFKNFLRTILSKNILKIEIIFKFLCVQDYKKYLKILNSHIKKLIKVYPNLIPTFITNWDNTPRYGSKGIVLHNVRPAIFYKKISKLKSLFKKKKIDMIFIKAWNEWAEGNVIEHSHLYKNKYMKIIKKIKNNFK